MNTFHHPVKTPVIRTREYLFDNYKALLILLVVCGHFIEPSSEYDQNPLFYNLKWGIYSFHMPAFVFISGYFSKKKASLKKLCTSIMIPYFVYEVLYYLLYQLLDKETDFYFARPKFSLWYLMALFVWKLAAPAVQKIPGHMILSVAAGILVGFTELDNLFSIPRILYFFPFFLAGQKFDSSILTRLRTPAVFRGALAVLGIYLVFLFTDNFHTALTPKIFYGRYSYAEMGFAGIQGAGIRLLCYALSSLLLFLFFLVLPRRQTFFSCLGEKTMPIYICHGFIFSAFKYGTELLNSVAGPEESLALLLFCIFLVWLLSRKFFCQITEKISHLIAVP